MADAEDIVEKKIVPTFLSFLEGSDTPYEAYKLTCNSWPEGVFHRCVCALAAV